jgi:redox-sensitive bicupin YhaK (pirin superfamily)
MTSSFVLRADERGFNKILSTGPTASYVGGHPDAFVTRSSSFNFHEYQGGRPGFGRMRVFGDEAFNNPGCSYSMHPHHNFIICAFVLEGQLIHVNTTGKVDELNPGDFYAFSAGSGGLHTEINIEQTPMKAIYIWMLPDRLLLPPTYGRSHYDADASIGRIITLVGDVPGALPIPQDIRISRLTSDGEATHVYRPRSRAHGLYTFVIEGSLTCDSAELGRRDSKGVWDSEEITCRTGPGRSDILFVESIM